MNRLDEQISSTPRRRRRPASPSGMVTSGARIVTISSRRAGGRGRRGAVRAFDQGGGTSGARPAGPAGGGQGDHEHAAAHRGHDPPGGPGGGGEAGGERAVQARGEYRAGHRDAEGGAG